MLIKESFADVQTNANGKESSMSMDSPLELMGSQLPIALQNERLTFNNANCQESSCSNLPFLDTQTREHLTPKKKEKTFVPVDSPFLPAASPELYSSVRSTRVRWPPLRPEASNLPCTAGSWGSHWPRCSLCQADCRPGLHCRRSQQLP